MLNRTFFLLTLLGAGPLAAQETNGTPVEVVRSFHVAISSGDSASALALIAPDVVIYESGGVEASREEYRSHHLGADMRFASAVTRRVTAQQEGIEGDVAWVLSETMTTGTLRGRRIESRGTETVILRRTPQGWKIVHIHWSAARG